MPNFGNLGRALVLVTAVLAVGAIAWTAASPALSRSAPDRPARVAREHPDSDSDSQVEGPEDSVSEPEDGGERSDPPPQPAVSTVPTTDDYARGDD